MNQCVGKLCRNYIYKYAHYGDFCSRFCEKISTSASEKKDKPEVVQREGEGVTFNNNALFQTQLEVGISI